MKVAAAGGAGRAGAAGDPGFLARVRRERNSELLRQLDQLDRTVTSWMARRGITLLRTSLGLVFLWFGVLKLIPGLSPAEELVGRTLKVMTFGLVPPEIGVPFIGVWEAVIGLGLLTGRALRFTLFLLFLQMAGTIMPVFLFPGDVFANGPFVPTMEGQYIIKNLVLISAALVIGATVRGGRLKPEPTGEFATSDVNPN